MLSGDALRVKLLPLTDATGLCCCDEANKLTKARWEGLATKEPPHGSVKKYRPLARDTSETIIPRGKPNPTDDAPRHSLEMPWCVRATSPGGGARLCL
jgi:hypothetical protein